MIDLNGILKEIESLPFWVDGSLVEMSITQSGGIPPEMASRPYICAAIGEIVQQRLLQPLHLMINKLPPGVTVPKHTDKVIGGELERWHLPIVTNPKATWWDDEINRYVHMSAGVWHGPVKYWIPHFIENLGDKDRIHLIVDLAEKIPNKFRPMKRRDVPG